MSSGRQRYARFILGCYKSGTADLNNIFDYISKNISADSNNLLICAENFAGHVIPKISVKSDASSDVGKSLCHLFNFWLPYQNGICRMRARSGFYQSGGAYGFRDQLQDALTLMYADAAEAKTHIIRSAAHQFEGTEALFTGGISVCLAEMRKVQQTQRDFTEESAPNAVTTICSWFTRYASISNLRATADLPI